MSPTTIQSKAVNLVSVNTAPDRAKKVIGAVIENVRDRYDIVHAGNSISKSSWTPEQQEEIQQIARDTIPGIKIHAIPTGLQVQVGPEGVVKYIIERIDEIMSESESKYART
ncbi:MAG: hypothetical protein TREMPRED_003826 [Tremellales sp. Tagirdzhanova-0007]|nr:MAG: hypothetical protein TREMPRED_003826 [Tremellales sp. Tagirdzhanova-0007]